MCDITFPIFTSTWVFHLPIKTNQEANNTHLSRAAPYHGHYGTTCICGYEIQIFQIIGKDNSASGLASVFINFTFIQSFQSLGVADLWICVKEKLPCVDPASTVSAWSHNTVRPPTSPTSLWRYSSAMGTLPSPGGLWKMLDNHYGNRMMDSDIPLVLQHIRPPVCLFDYLHPLSFRCTNNLLGCGHTELSSSSPSSSPLPHQLVMCYLIYLQY